MPTLDFAWFFGSIVILLVVGDFASTFFYHVPQHVWEKLHLREHHDKSRSYWDHSIVSRDPMIVLDGLLGALPYFAIAALLMTFGRAAIAGAIVGLLIGRLHVLYRHTCELGWSSPRWLVRFGASAALVLPEDHQGHHDDPDAEFGDLFRFYDAPARAFIRFARNRLRRQRRLLRIRAFRASRIR